MKALGVAGCGDDSTEVSIVHLEAPHYVREDEVITRINPVLRTEQISLFKVMIDVKAATLDYIDLRIAKGHGRGLHQLVNRCGGVSHIIFDALIKRPSGGTVRHSPPPCKAYF